MGGEAATGLPGLPAVPTRLDLIVQSGLAPAASRAVDLALLGRAGADRPPVLRVYECRGTLVALGRYHVAPGGAGGGGVGLVRRLTGGRVAPFGEGFIGVSLVLPHRAALVAADPHALRPEQVMNRYVRGILEGCTRAGVPAYYPGRDLVTVDGRILGLVSFDVASDGPCLFEAVLACGSPFAELPRRLDVCDPGGVVPAAMLHPEETTSLAAILGRVPALDEVAGWLAAGCQQRFGVHSMWSAPPPPAPVDEDAWVASRSVRPDLDRRASTAIQLGTLLAELAVDGATIREARLTGDFIADSPGIAALEGALRGCPGSADAIAEVVRATFGAGEHFILGVGPLDTVVDTLVRGLRA